MKQKRKVKSLLPQWNGGKSFLMLSLLILWLILCLWSLSLLTTSSVWAIWKDIDKVAYSWLDDVTEVLYHMDLADPEHLDQKVGEMYYKTSEWTFYIAWPSMVVNSENPSSSEKNEIGNTNFSNILWWVWNKIYSDNITLVEGSEISVAASNNNAVVLGWVWNKIIWNGWSDPVIMVWWSDNKIDGGHNGDVIIWGSHNTIGSSVSNSFILWWNGNTVNANNAIVWGSNVTVPSWVDNVFVYSSNWSFSPNKAKTFYLNVANGLWVNIGSNKPWLSVKWPVRFGTVDISETCDNDSLWVIWTWNTCLVGCTTKSRDDSGKWELLDRWKKCQDACENNMRCYNEMENLEEPESYTSYCSKGVDTSNASPCTPVWNSYNNVVFETALVNSKKYGGVCPDWAADKCVYQCNEWYYLTGDKTQSNFIGSSKWKTKCYAECDLTKLLWSEWYDDWKPIILKHNEIVIAYDVNDTTCARDNPYLWNDKWTRGDAFPEHCGNNQHKKPLICVNGKMEIAKGYNLGSQSNNQNVWAYTHRNCAVHPFTCDTSHLAFDLDRYTVTTTLLDPIKTDTTTDRNKMIWTRWTYKLCLDYSVLPNPQNTVRPGNEVCNKVLTSTPYIEHYKWLWCNSWYDPNTRDSDPDYMCRKRCTHNAQNTTITRKDMEKVTLYRTKDENCSNPLNSTNVWSPCDAKTFTCDDGTWRPDDGYSDINNYRYTSCTEHWNACSDHIVDASTMASHTDHSDYLGPCYRWWAWDNSVNKTYSYGNPTVKWQCDYKGAWYKLDGCRPEECYHANSSKTYCEKDYLQDWSCSSPSNWWSVGTRYYHWDWSGWNGKSKTRKNTCDIYCNRSSSEWWYYRYGNSCYKNSVCGWDGMPSSHYGAWTWWKHEWSSSYSISHGSKDYYVIYHESGTPGTTGYKIEKEFESDWCYYCNSLYHLEGTSCVSDKHDCWWEIPENAVANWNDYSYSYYKWWTHDKNYWECHFKCRDWYIWNGYACQEEECDSCIWKVTYDAGIWTVSRTSDTALCNNSITLIGANSECNDFVWRTDGSTLYTQWTSITKSYTTSVPLTAVWWGRKNLPNCQYGCKWWDQPTLPYANMDYNDKATWDTNVEWYYQSNQSATLTDCQWRCKEWYKKVWGTCVKQTCEAWTTAIPTQWVRKWDSEYVWNAGKKWTRVQDTQTDLSECQWRCDYPTWVWSGSTCVENIEAACGPSNENPEHYNCKGKSTLKASSDKTIPINGKVAWWTWTCLWAKNTSKDCVQCAEWYSLTSDGKSCQESKCGWTGPSSSCTTAYKWAVSYAGTETKNWAYKTWVAQSDLKACEWSCMEEYEKSWNCCIKTKYGKCGNPEVHYECEEWKAEEKKTITWWWTWMCKWTQEWGDAECIECDEENWYKKVKNAEWKWVCESANKEDWKCDFDNGWCLGWKYEERSSWGPYGKAWACKGVLNWSSEECVLQWDCAWECKLNVSDGSCGDMYHRRSEYWKDECAAAWEYVTYGQAGGITSRWPCWTYIPSSTAWWVEWWLYSTNKYCPDAVAQAQYWWKWTSCFKYESKLKCNTFINGTKTTYEWSDAVSKCNAILAKKPTDCTDSNPWGWNVQTYTLTINANGWTYGGQTSYTYQAWVSLSVLTTQPTREWYNFKEWNSQSNGNGTTYNSTSTMPASNLTVYAVWEKKEETVSCTSEWLYDTYFSNDCYIQKTVGDKTCYKKWCDTWYECYVYNQTIPTWVWSYVVAYGWWIACVKETEWWTRTYEQWGCPNTYTDSCPSDSPAWTSCTAQQKANIAKCCVQKNGQATQYVCK